MTEDILGHLVIAVIGTIAGIAIGKVIFNLLRK